MFSTTDSDYAQLLIGEVIRAGKVGADGCGERPLVTTATYDRAFAAAWAESRARGRSLGRRRLRDELRGRGVARPLVEAAIERAFEDTSELSRARDAAARRLTILQRRAPDQAARRLHPSGTGF